MSSKERCAEQRRLNQEAGLRADGQPRSDSVLPPQRNDLEFMLSEIEFLREYERHRYEKDGAPPPMTFIERAELRRLEIARSNRALGLKGDGKPRVYSTKPLSMKPSAGPGPCISRTQTGGVEMRNSLNAWRRALAILDAGETLIRDQIERDLLGWKFWPIARTLAAVEKLCADIAAIRIPTIKAAFRTIRDAVGNEDIAGASLAAWSSAFAKADAVAIKHAIDTGIAEELDSEEIARKVVGSKIKNGTDGATEKLRFHTAWLSRSCPVVEDDGPKVMAAAQKILDDIMRDAVP